ncbi:hypothetical protein AB0M47_21680 [Hamadaea sp. NPDC051192]|uniref:hypothetical protein n=1 Tax=Hamadaea sp. NPDC051192 TaxID=3154940 RepID=UPI00343DBB3D
MRRFAPRAVAVAAVLGAGLLAMLLGLPGVTTVTLDRCHVTYDRLERQQSRCDGHWQSLFGTAHGPVNGAFVGTDWQAVTAEPDSRYEWEVTIPESGRRQLALIGPGRAYAVAALNPLKLAPQLCVALLLLPALGLMIAIARRAARDRAQQKFAD